MNPLHYPSIELCKKLTEIGFPITTMFTQQSSYFGENWYIVMNTKIRDEIFNPKCFENWSTTSDMKKEIVYPSIMEMIDIIPRGRGIEILQDGLFVVRQSYTEEGDESECIENKLPNALAKQIIWLVENNHITFPINAQ